MILSTYFVTGGLMMSDCGKMRNDGIVIVRGEAWITHKEKIDCVFKTVQQSFHD